MTKRRTIGENPLDVDVSENPLDAVVPGSRAAKPGKSAPGREESTPVRDPRLDRLELTVKTLSGELARLRWELTELRRQLPKESWWMTRLKDKLAGK